MNLDMGGEHRHGNKWIFLVEKHRLQPRLMRTRMCQQLWDQTRTQQQNFPFLALSSIRWAIQKVAKSGQISYL